jgi:hypothetical protein
MMAAVIAGTPIGGLAIDISAMPTWHQTVGTLPVLAQLSDIAGTGEVTESRSNGFRIVVSNYWTGNPGSNILDIVVDSYAPPETNAPVVFFATTNAFFKVAAFGPGEQACRWSVLTNRTESVPIVPLSLPLDYRSWFNESLDDGIVASYASNLVYRAKVNPNPHAFYELVRDGANTPASSSLRTRQDSISTLVRWAFYESEEYVAMMWSDPLIPAPVRAAIKFRFPHWE